MILKWKIPLTNICYSEATLGSLAAQCCHTNTFTVSQRECCFESFKCVLSLTNEIGLIQHDVVSRSFPWAAAPQRAKLSIELVRLLLFSRQMLPRFIVQGCENCLCLNERQGVLGRVKCCSEIQLQVSRPWAILHRNGTKLLIWKYINRQSAHWTKESSSLESRRHNEKTKPKFNRRILSRKHRWILLLVLLSLPINLRRHGVNEA